MKNYTVYHLHDKYSNCNGFYDSCTDYKDYIKLAKKNNMKAIAFSNHGGIYDWVKKKQDCDKAKLKYIHGIELYLCTEFSENERGYHIGLYSRNFEGVKELNDLCSNATLKGKQEDNSDRHFYYNPRISIKELMETSDNIIITTACLASILWKKKDDDIVVDILKWMSKNKHRCFLEIQYHSHIDQIEFNKLLYKWSKQYSIPLIAGTDTHSSTKYKAECRKILQKSKGSFYGDEDEFDLIWKTYDELVEKFKEQCALPEEVYLEAIENTNKFADMIESFELDRSFKYPNLYGKDAINIWMKTIVEKLQYKYDNNIIDIKQIDKYKHDVKIEFEAMKKQGMESFMMFMSELVDYCTANNIPYGPCRGSVGGSLIAYITDITDVDPVRWNTVFSRFCNADRISLADIDIDFAPEDRAKVFEFIKMRFGLKKASYIAQFGTLKDKATIEVLARGLEYNDLKLVEQIKSKFLEYFTEYAKIIQAEVNIEELENIDAKKIDFDYIDIYIGQMRNKIAISKIKNLKEKFEQLKKENKDLFYYFDGIKGTIISKGNHPAGMIGSPITLSDNIGVFYQNGDENFPISTCAMKAVDWLNFVKFDILGLKTIGIIKDTYKYINSHYLKSHEIDWSDKKVWEDMITCNIGVFQFEGSKYAGDLLKQFKPYAINDMSLVNASLRPSGKSYRDRLISKEINKNPSKQIDELLKENYGYLVFQEDSIKFLTDICGFSGSLADFTRRCIGKKDYDGLQEQLPKILEGYCEKSDKPREVAEEEAKQFLKIIDDSSEYQFGLNHSTGYSQIGFITARQRYYYPLEFTTAYLNNAKSMEDHIDGKLLAEHKNITIENIKFRKSIDKYTFDKDVNTIYKGIASIKNCNGRIALELYELKDNKYNNFIELLVDIKEKTSVQSDQLEILTKLNFFSEFGKNKKLLQQIDLFRKFYGRKQINKNKDLEKLEISEELIAKYSNKKTAVMYKELDMTGLINELSEKIEDKSLNVKEQIKTELEYLEYITTIVREAKDCYYVKEFKTYKNKLKPYLLLYDISTGEELKTKVTSEEQFVHAVFKEGSVLRVKKFKEQKKSKKIDGKWTKIDELEKILVEWDAY